MRASPTQRAQLLSKLLASVSDSALTAVLEHADKIGLSVERPNSWQTLNLALLSLVSDFLGYRDLLAIDLVSKFWRNGMREHPAGWIRWLEKPFSFSQQNGKWLRCLKERHVHPARLSHLTELTFNWGSSPVSAFTKALRTTVSQLPDVRICTLSAFNATSMLHATKDLHKIRTFVITPRVTVRAEQIVAFQSTPWIATLRTFAGDFRDHRILFPMMPALQTLSIRVIASDLITGQLRSLIKLRSVRLQLRHSSLLTADSVSVLADLSQLSDLRVCSDQEFEVEKEAWTTIAAQQKLTRIVVKDLNPVSLAEALQELGKCKQLISLAISCDNAPQDEQKADLALNPTEMTMLSGLAASSQLKHLRLPAFSPVMRALGPILADSNALPAMTHLALIGPDALATSATYLQNRKGLCWLEVGWRNDVIECDNIIKLTSLTALKQLRLVNSNVSSETKACVVALDLHGFAIEFDREMSTVRLFTSF